MAKDKLTQYDSIASNNLDVGGISIAEGMLPSNVNNAMREQMSHLADFVAGTSGVDVLKFQDDTDTNSIKIQAPASVTTTTTLTLPDGAGSANQSLTTNGSGTLSWSTRIGNVVEDTTPQLGGNLDTNGNDITFGDNDKAIFGAGSDLQVYHSGTHSWINENGTGNLYIQSSGAAINITNGSSRNLAQFNTTAGTATLYYDNGTSSSAKLATTSGGIDVTGSVTADGLTVSGATEFQDNPVISNGSPELTFETTNASHSNWQIAAQESLSQAFEISSGQQDADASDDTWTKRFTVKNDGDISFYDSTGVTQGFFWDASTQRLGLGTTAPAGLMEVKVASGQSGATQGYRLVTADGGGYALYPTSAVANPTFLHNVNSGESQAFGEGGFAHMTITSGGSVGIGTASPSKTLTVHGSDGTPLLLQGSGIDTAIAFAHSGTTNAAINSSSDGAIEFRAGGAGLADEAMRITSGGNVGIGTSSPSLPLHINGSSAGDGIAYSRNGTEYFRIDDTGTDMNLKTTGGGHAITFNTSGSERMRIDASGVIRANHTTASGNGFIVSRGTGTYAAFGAFVAANGQWAMTFHNASDVRVGNIVVNASSTAYNTSSDYRLKENVVDMTGATERLKQLNPVRFNFIADADTTVDGFLAHEVQDIVPEAITGTKDAMRDEEYEVTPAVLDADGNVVTEAVMGTRSVPDYQGIDQSKLVPLLTAALQEALTKIDDLETRLAALEAN